ncbi:MAG: BREX-1 system phosphatase PglZ type A [Chthoniobacterales bacterium]|nr:BREX-1 system phosphatase PglZ type A [Chthoniobacterales bacterium]
MKRIHESLQQTFQRHRLVFWYDTQGEWRKVFDAFAVEGVEKLVLDRNDFGLKVKILGGDVRARFLVYSPSARPPDADNWLLDLLLQGHEFKADRASLAVQEVGLPYEFRSLAEEHVEFFKDPKRAQAFKEAISKHDGVPELRLKMMAIMAGCPAEIDLILLEFLKRASRQEMFDPAEAALGEFNLLEPFWKEVGRLFGYSPETPSLRDFAVTLFRGANPLDSAVSQSAHAVVFLQRWKDSQSHRESFRAWASALEQDFRVASQLEAAGGKLVLGGADTFEVFEKFTIHQLCRAFEDGARAEDVQQRIQARRNSFWFPEHQHGYGAIQQAVTLRELIASAELTVDSVEAGVERYRKSWWKIDRAYREACLHLRRYGQVNVMERLAGWLGKTYVNNFLLPLADRWGDRVGALEKWACTSLTPQQRFYETFVAPYLEKGQKVFVIVSDALRYEAAASLAERINTENRFTAEVDAVLSSLPSFTQLGMAALLPGSKLELDPASGQVAVDGRSATGTENRGEILRAATGGRGAAIQAERFLELNTKTEGRTLMREHDVIYIYHNTIDKTGDALATEAKTFEAVEHAFEELLQITKKVANVNGNNMLLVSDHGFLFQQDPLSEDDDTQFPAGAAWLMRNRRFAITESVGDHTGVITFSADQLDLPGTWHCAFPKSLGRFPIQGSGKRYVHGGFTLQETVVPVIHIHKARTDDTGRVEVEFMRVPSKITTGQVALSLYQEKAVTTKLLPRTLRVGLYAKDGAVLSEVKVVQADIDDEDPRKREFNLVLVLSRTADSHNNTEAEIRLEETLPGTAQTVTYKSHPIKIQKPFTSDFDES